MSEFVKGVDEVADIQKTLVQVQGSGFQLRDMTEAIERVQVQPGLLTALLGSSAQNKNLKTTTAEFDMTKETIQLPAGKSYSEKGPDLPKDGAENRFWKVPSFGFRTNAAPEDYAERRKPGTMDMLTEQDVVGQLAVKANKAIDLHEELAWAQLLTADTNIISSGPFTEYNFYTDLVGSSRPAKTDMLLEVTTENHKQLFRHQTELARQAVARAGDSFQSAVVICGTTAFNERAEIEEQQGLARDLRSTVDLASQLMPTNTFGDKFQYNYENFMGTDGLLYIHYGASILGTKLIGDNDMYLVPVGTQNLFRTYHAPSRTRSYVNSEALPLYTWSFVDEWQGVTNLYEFNKLYACVNPAAIQHLTFTP